MVSPNVQDEYDRLAARYDDRWATYVRRTTDRTLEFLRPAAGERILDIGSGTGALLRAIGREQPDAALFGLDLSLRMLQVARERWQTPALLTGGDAHRLPFGPAAFDAVVSVSSFHFWPRPAEALSEIARVLRGQGRLVVTDWCDDFLACRICDRLLRVTSAAHHPILGSARCRQLVQSAGFTVETLARYKVSWLWGMMTMTARRGEAGP